jgi:hypothetical protein
MKLPQLQRILREDIPEAPSWIAKLLGPLNSFIDSLYNGLNKNITHDENIDCQLRDLAFTTSSTYTSGDWSTISFKRSTKQKAKGVILLDIRIDQDYFSPITSATSLSWQEVNGNIQIEYIAGLANSTTYTGKVLII